MRLRALAVPTLVAVVVLTIAMTEQTLASQADAAASEALASVAAQDAQAAPAAIPTPVAPFTTKSTGTTDRPSSVSGGDPVPPVAAAPARKVVSASAVVVAFARSHLRARYRHGATGPSSFDCSGLMWRVFREAGLGGKVTSTSARAIYASYRSRGLTSRTKPQIGDLVIWGRGSHVGVYIGKGLAISALVQGVRVHRVHAMFTPFTAYLRTHLSSIEKPAWELDLARHMKTLRHATRAVFLHESASRSSGTTATIRSGTRFVVVGKHRDGAGRVWLKALTFAGKTGWLRATASAG